jgi:hypothetical protein
VKPEVKVLPWDTTDSKNQKPPTGKLQRYGPQRLNLAVLTNSVSSTSTPVSVAGLENFLQFYTGFYMRELVSSGKPDIRTKVAILDTGVNKGLFVGNGQRVFGASFSHRNPGPKERESPWWLATDPHGSYVANIVSQLDPLCELYIAQVAVYKNKFSLRSTIQVGALEIPRTQHRPVWT